MFRSSAAVLVFTIAAQAAPAPLWIVNHSITTRSGEYDFKLVFNHRPDFLTVDSHNRQADEFQYYVNDDGHMGTVIRGGEIHVQNDIPIRDLTLPITDPYSGGWGGVSGRVPYVLRGAVLRFSVPMDLISKDGRFSYKLESYHYGEWTLQEIEGRVDVGTARMLAMPEPITMGLAALGCVLLSRRQGA